MLMEKIVFFLFFLVSYRAIAQPVDFETDAAGKFFLQEVVEVPGMSKDRLFKNAAIFLKKIKVHHSSKKYLVSDLAKDELHTKGSFYVYKLGSVKKAIAGAVMYDVKIEVKEGKYRYMINNYIFNTYKRNRYGKYGPVKGKDTPLDATVSKLNEKEWIKQRQVVYDKSMQLISNLYGEMIYTENHKSKKAKKSEEW